MFDVAIMPGLEMSKGTIGRPFEGYCTVKIACCSKEKLGFIMLMKGAENKLE